jgi:hypothetical protein
MESAIIERVGYCAGYLLTLCTDVSAVEKVEVIWVETGSRQTIEVAQELIIRGKGYYRLRMHRREASNDE